MPIVNIQWSEEGKTEDVKRNVANDVTEAISKNVGVDKGLVTILFSDLPTTNIASGGILKSDRLKSEV